MGVARVVPAKLRGWSPRCVVPDGRHSAGDFRAQLIVFFPSSISFFRSFLFLFWNHYSSLLSIYYHPVCTIDAARFTEYVEDVAVCEGPTNPLIWLKNDNFRFGDSRQFFWDNFEIHVRVFIYLSIFQELLGIVTTKLVWLFPVLSRFFQNSFGIPPPVPFKTKFRDCYWFLC